MSVGSLLVEHAEDRPDDPFLDVESDDGDVRCFTYAHMLDLAHLGARVLTACGVKPGERCALAIDNRSEFLACWFGAALLGATIVPMNPGSTRREFEHMIGHSRSRVVIAVPTAVDACRDAADVTVVEIGDAFDELRDSAATPPLPRAVDPLTPLGVLYTSGTTSAPKGVVVTHANYLMAGEVVARHLRVRSDDRWLVVLPMHHANAQYYCVMSALVSGASVAVMPRFSATRWGEQARRHRATLGSLFAAPIRMILNHPPASSDRDNALRITCFAQNVAAAEVEQVANEHPAVLESAAVGVPDDIRDEQLHLYIVVRAGASVDVQDLIEHCAARLAKFKVPRKVHVVDELPRTAVGKVQKHRLVNPPAAQQGA